MLVMARILIAFHLVISSLEYTENLLDVIWRKVLDRLKPSHRHAVLKPFHLPL